MFVCIFFRNKKRNGVVLNQFDKELLNYIQYLYKNTNPQNYIDFAKTKEINYEDLHEGENVPKFLQEVSNVYKANGYTGNNFDNGWQILFRNAKNIKRNDNAFDVTLNNNEELNLFLITLQKVLNPVSIL